MNTYNGDNTEKRKEQLVHCTACRGVLFIIEQEQIEQKEQHVQIRLRCPHCQKNWRADCLFGSKSDVTLS